MKRLLNKLRQVYNRRNCDLCHRAATGPWLGGWRCNRCKTVP